MSKRYLRMRLVPLPAGPGRDDADPVARWAAVARRATDPCVVVDAAGRVAAMSPAAARLLGQPEDVAGTPIDDVLVLLDFTHTAGLASASGRRVPPVVAVTEGQLSRGVLRVRGPDGRPLMLDAVATPLHDQHDRVVGALSFFAAV